MDHLHLALGEIPNLRIWRQNTGSVTFKDPRTGQIRTFSSGVPNGAGDLSGIWGPTGQRIEIEAKATGGRFSTPQVHWGNFIESYHGLYLAATQHKGATPEESAREWKSSFQKKITLCG